MIDPVNKVELDAAHLFRKVEPIGSRVVCNPAPTNTDADYVCLAAGFSGSETLLKALEALGYTSDLGPTYANEPFRSFRKGEVNLIVTHHSDFFDRTMLATQVCKKLNLLNKGDRVMVFRAVRDGKWLDRDEYNGEALHEAALER